MTNINNYTQAQLDAQSKIKKYVEHLDDVLFGNAEFINDGVDLLEGFDLDNNSNFSQFEVSRLKADLERVTSGDNLRTFIQDDGGLSQLSAQAGANSLNALNHILNRNTQASVDSALESAAQLTTGLGPAADGERTAWNSTALGPNDHWNDNGARFTTKGGYTVLTDVNQGGHRIAIFDPEGSRISNISGDPHVGENHQNGSAWDWHFGDDSTFILPDGTKIGLNTKAVNKSRHVELAKTYGQLEVVTVSRGLFIQSDDEVYQTGQDYSDSRETRESGIRKLDIDRFEFDRQNADMGEVAKGAGVFAWSQESNEGAGGWAVLNQGTGNFHDVTNESWNAYLQDATFDDQMGSVVGVTDSVKIATLDGENVDTFYSAVNSGASNVLQDVTLDLLNANQSERAQKIVEILESGSLLGTNIIENFANQKDSLGPGVQDLFFKFVEDGRDSDYHYAQSLLNFVEAGANQEDISALERMFDAGQVLTGVVTPEQVNIGRALDNIAAIIPGISSPIDSIKDSLMSSDVDPALKGMAEELVQDFFTNISSVVENTGLTFEDRSVRDMARLILRDISSGLRKNDSDYVRSNSSSGYSFSIFNRNYADQPDLREVFFSFTDSKLEKINNSPELTNLSDPKGIANLEGFSDWKAEYVRMSLAEDPTSATSDDLVHSLDARTREVYDRFIELKPNATEAEIADVVSILNSNYRDVRRVDDLGEVFANLEPDGFESLKYLLDNDVNIDRAVNADAINNLEGLVDVRKSIVENGGSDSAIDRLDNIIKIATKFSESFSDPVNNAIVSDLSSMFSNVVLDDDLSSSAQRSLLKEVSSSLTSVISGSSRGTTFDRYLSGSRADRYAQNIGIAGSTEQRDQFINLKQSTLESYRSQLDNLPANAADDLRADLQDRVEQLQQVIDQLRTY